MRGQGEDPPWAATRFEAGWSARRSLVGSAPRWSAEQVDVERDLRHRLFGRTTAEPRRIGRYVLGRRLGQGSFGDVFEAHDPELGRSVAIKVARSGPRSTRARARFLREAQALAGLSHPHVVSVFDFGIIEEGSRFVAYYAMERLETDLRAWLRTPRSLEARLRVLIEAGLGLAAAHAVGLVHRDFKPGNVLIGPDGRPRVGDFGLVLRSTPEESDETVDAVMGEGDATMERDGPVRLTRSGTVMGTPQYMAPEQHAESDVDARADQFAFCAAVYEACCGLPPFTGKSLEQLARAKYTGAIRRPPLARLPRRLRRVIERGLAPSPLDRYPTMRELVEDLRKATARPQWFRRSVAMLLPVTLGAVFTVGAATWWRKTSRSVDRSALESSAWGRSERPESARLQPDSSWDAKTRDALERLDALQAAAKWEQTQREATALIAEAERSADERLRAIALFRRGAAFERMDARVRAAADLEAAYFAAIEAADFELAAAAASYLALLRGWNEADRAEAESWAAHAQAAVERQPSDAAEAGLITSQASMYLSAGDFARAIEHAQEAIALHEAVGSPAAAAGARNVLANALMRSGQEAAGIEQLGLALADLEAIHGPDHPHVAMVLGNLGTAVGNTGDHAEAMRLLERAISVARKTHGQAHPMVVGFQGNLALERLRLGDVTAAVRDLEVVLAATQRLHDGDHPEVAHVHQNLGIALAMDGRLDESVEHLQRALSIQQAVLGPEHPDVAETLMGLGDVLAEMKDAASAAEHYARALDVAVASWGPDDPLVAELRDKLARAKKPRPDSEVELQDLE